MDKAVELMCLYWTTAGIFPGQAEISRFDFKDRVESAARAGKLRALPGLGEKSEAQVLAGIESLAAALAEDRDTLEYVHEPYLIQQGFLVRTPRGRQATRQAYEHMNLPLPSSGRNGPSGQGSLF